jgi:hypothetical protein
MGKLITFFNRTAGMSVTKLSLAGSEYIIKLFPARESLLVSSPAGEGKIGKLFLQSVMLYQILLNRAENPIFF